MTALWMPVNDVAGEQSTIAAAKRWQSRLFTSSGTWTVPADVGVIWIDLSSGGSGGGGGGGAAGGGGGGGSSSGGYINLPICVVPLESLTLTIGAGGAGGAVLGAGADGGITSLISATQIFDIRAPYYGSPGTALNGGAGGGVGGSGAPGAGGTSGGNGGVGASAQLTIWNGAYNTCQVGFTMGGGGGAAVTGNGGKSVGPRIAADPTNGIGGANGGGGGCGGTSHFCMGKGGSGGSNGNAGGNATGYGCGGGGGSGNAPGGNGSPGFIRIYCFSATTI